MRELLAPRQIEVLRLASEGPSNAEIGAALGEPSRQRPTSMVQSGAVRMPA